MLSIFTNLCKLKNYLNQDFVSQNQKYIYYILKIYIRSILGALLCIQGSKNWVKSGTKKTPKNYQFYSLPAHFYAVRRIGTLRRYGHLPNGSPISTQREKLRNGHFTLSCPIYAQLANKLNFYI